MKSAISYREIHYGEEAEACLLVMGCFHEFVAPGYSQEGIAEFARYVDPESMRLRLVNNHFVIVALDRAAIIGVIEVRNNNHISLFFVNKDYQNRGIGRTLHELAIRKCRASSPDVAVIEVNSSPYAVGIYEKLGFVRLNEEQTTNGMRYTPMALRLT
jgi:GNAT superfamily N-acetyltransferase